MSSSSSDRHRRMDLYLFLCQPHTADSAREAGAYSARQHLQRIFAPDIESTWHFKERLRTDLKEIAKVYPHFRVELKGDMLQLWRSPSPVPPMPAIPVPKKTAKSLKNTTC